MNVTIELIRGSHNDAFHLILSEDGQAELRDIDYGDTCVGEHGLTADDMEALRRAQSKQAEERPGQPADAPLDFDFLEDLSDSIDNLFEELNRELPNPVGDPPGDEPDYTKAGTVEMLHEALDLVCDLAYLYEFPERRFLVIFGDDTERATVDGPEQLEELVQELLNAFDPIGFTLEYVDENDGRLTAYAVSCSRFEYPMEDVSPVRHLVTARDRLEAIMREVGADVARLEPVFPAFQALEQEK
jgi:hypothetical protein